MKSLLSIIILCLSVVSFAQTNASKSAAPTTNQSGNNPKKDLTPEQRATRVIRMMSHKVSLTEAQHAALKPLVNEREVEKEKIKTNSSLDSKSKRAAIMEINTKYDALLKKELSPEQWTKYEEFRVEMKAKRAEKKDAKTQQESTPDMEEGFY